MNKREAAFTTRFEKWARKYVRAPAVFEVKQSKGPLPFSAVKDHQRNALLAAHSERPFAYKIPDVGPAHRPFDVALFGFIDAYVVVKFDKNFYGIGIDHFLEEEKRSDRKSLTEDRAAKISDFVGDFARG